MQRQCVRVFMLLRIGSGANTRGASSTEPTGRRGPAIARTHAREVGFQVGLRCSGYIQSFRKTLGWEKSG